jgi:hypothetical protein
MVWLRAALLDHCLAAMTGSVWAHLLDELMATLLVLLMAVQ